MCKSYQIYSEYRRPARDQWARVLVELFKIEAQPQQEVMSFCLQEIFKKWRLNEHLSEFRQNGSSVGLRFEHPNLNDTFLSFSPFFFFQGGDLICAWEAQPKKKEREFRHRSEDRIG